MAFLSIGDSPTQFEIEPKIPQRHAGDRDEISNVLIVNHKIVNEIQNQDI